MENFGVVVGCGFSLPFFPFPSTPTPTLCMHLKTVTSQLFVFWICYSLDLDEYLQYFFYLFLENSWS